MKNLKIFPSYPQCLLSAFGLLFIVLMACPIAGANIISIQGKEGHPYFDDHGNFYVIYINDEGGISVASVQKEPVIRTFSTHEIHDAKNVQFVRATRDKFGKIWILWEERNQAESEIYIGELNNKRIIRPIHVTARQDGLNFSPCLDVSMSNDVWVTWINYYQKKYSLLVKNLSAEQTWKLNTPSLSTSHSPQILIGQTGTIWILWVGQLRKRDEILYTRFDGEAWSPPQSLNQSWEVPHITPSSSIDIDGSPHVVWSAYDGENYEIYYTRWENNRWRVERQITDNLNIADTSPAIALLFDTIPIVAWLRYVNGKRRVLLTYRFDERWIEEMNLSDEETITKSPQLVSFGGKIGIIWQTENEIKTTLFHLSELYQTPLLKEGHIHFPNILALNKDRHIGFGDSITFGVIQNQPAPDKGYIPRLEGLIDENIKDSEVINRGVGGENTAEGLSRFDTVINADQAETIYLMEGTNDIKDSGISMDTAAFNLREMARKARDFGMTVFLASIIPLDPWEGIIQERVLDLNARIRSIASNLNVYFVDQFAAFGGFHSGTHLYSDATHPNEQGYQLLAETFYGALVDLLPYIEIDSETLFFKTGIGEPNPPPQVFKIKNSGQGVLDYQISANQTWINVSSTSGTSTGEWDDIQVSVDISSLSQGAYLGEVTVTAEYTPNSPQVILIELSISSPIIEVDKTSLAFEAEVGESNPPPQTFKVRNSGEGTLKYQITANQDWINASPTDGDSTEEWDDIQVSVDISSLSRGTHQGELIITGENAPNSPYVIMIELILLGPLIQVDTASLSFEGVKGEPNPVPQTFKIRNAGESQLVYTISENKKWISVSPTSGTSTGEWDDIRVSIDISNLSPGTFQAPLAIRAEKTSNSPQNVNINLTILSPIIKLNKTSMSFEATVGEPNPQTQTFTIKNSGVGTLQYQIQVTKDWLSVSPQSGNSTGERDRIEVSVDISNLSSENNTGQVIVTAEHASNSPQKLDVFLLLQLPPLFPPINFGGEKKTNRSLSQSEYINVLLWEANPENKFIEQYKISLIEEGKSSLLAVLDADTFEYWHRGVNKDQIYSYGLTAVDKFGRESEPIYIEIR